VAPAGTEVRNPAFDVTPAELISGIVTEEGVLRGPFETGLRDATERARERWASMPGFGAIRPAAATDEPAPAVDADSSRAADDPTGARADTATAVQPASVAD
jgi:hypothetical protein